MSVDFIPKCFKHLDHQTNNQILITNNNGMVCHPSLIYKLVNIVEFIINKHLIKK